MWSELEEPAFRVRLAVIAERISGIGIKRVVGVEWIDVEGKPVARFQGVTGEGAGRYQNDGGTYA